MAETKKNRVYIAGPITGREYQDYKKHFTSACMRLLERGEHPISPIGIGIMFPEFNHTEIMKICIAVLSSCDEIYMLKGWDKSKGAQIERSFAAKKGLKIRYEEEDK